MSKIVKSKGQSTKVLFSKSPNDTTHIYNKSGYVEISIVKNRKDEVVSIQEITKEPSSYKVTYVKNESGKLYKTVVVLDDGSVGIAKLNPGDMFSVQKGHDIALCRARIAHYNKTLKGLTGEK